MRCFHSRFISRLPIMLSALVLLVLMGATPAGAAGDKNNTQQHEHAAGELLVKFRSGVSDGDAQSVLKKHAGAGHSAKHFEAPKKVPYAAIGRWWHVKLGKGADAKQVIERIAKDSNVEAAELNYIVRAVATPNDPRYSELWGLNNIGQTGGVTDADIDAPEAWDRLTDSSTVVVAVIDTGIDYTHPDLVDNIWTNPDPNASDVHGYNFYNNTPDPFDDFGHGTHVAGTIGARGGNGVGVVG